MSDIRRRSDNTELLINDPFSDFHIQKDSCRFCNNAIPILHLYPCLIPCFARRSGVSLTAAILLSKLLYLKPTLRALHLRVVVQPNPTHHTSAPIRSVPFRAQEQRSRRVHCVLARRKSSSLFLEGKHPQKKQD